MASPRRNRQRLSTGSAPLREASGNRSVPTADKAIIKRLQGRYTYAKPIWDPILEAGRVDIDYISGETWDENDKKSRLGRLMLKFDQLNQYLNQLVNSVMQQQLAIKITPEGNGANDQTAEVRANRIRQIEYLSSAQEAYIAAFQGAAERSYGYCRIVAEWEPKGFKKQLRLMPIPNPDQVLPDPDFQRITGADWRYLFYLYEMSRDEYQRDFPDAIYQSWEDLSESDHQDAAGWQGVDRVQVAEYWEVNMEERTLLRLGTPEQYVDVYEDDRNPQQKAMPVLASRQAQVPTVCSYLTNGVELLSKKGQEKKTEWKGSTIPFIACYGKILHKSADTAALASGNQGPQSVGRKQILSYIRLARDAQKYYNWIKSTEGEAISMPPRTPYIGYRGQFTSEQLGLLQSSVSVPVPVVLVEPTTETTGDQVLPLPRREVPDPQIQGYEIAAEAARRDIQNALGRYSASVGRADTNVKSGVALKQLDSQSDSGSYHFINAYKAMIAEGGKKLEELLEFYDDTVGEISTRTASGKVKMVRVNDPNAVSPDGKPAHLPMNLGTHATTVSTGPNFDSEREEASAFADNLIGNQVIDRILGPQKAAQLLALAIKLKNVGPLGDEMAEIVNPQQEDDPRKMQSQLHEAMGQLQKQGAVLQEMHAIIEGKTLELKNKLEIEQERNRTELAKAKSSDDTRVKIAEIQFASAANVADIKASLDHSLALMTSQLETVQTLVSTHQTHLDRVHEATSQMEAQQHEREQAEAAAAQAQALAAAQPTEPAAPAGE